LVDSVLRRAREPALRKHTLDEIRGGEPPGSAVLAYVTDRDEDDFLVRLSSRIRRKRLPELPEPKK
jgi:hypothetical protein